MEAAYEYGIARCKRCGIMYEQSEVLQQCAFHPGEYGNHNGNSMHRSWSCCKSTEEFIRGCTTAGVHERCQETAAALASFPQVGGAGAMRAQRKEQQEAEQVEAEEERLAKMKARIAPVDAHRYTVVVGDSLASIALKHGMQVSNIKRWNKLLSSQLYPGQTLLVQAPKPLTPEELRSAAIKDLMKRAPCEKYEAAFYLDEHGGGVDVDTALAAHAADVRAGLALTPESDSEGWTVVGSPEKSKDV